MTHKEEIQLIRLEQKAQAYHRAGKFVNELQVKKQIEFFKQQCDARTRIGKMTMREAMSHLGDDKIKQVSAHIQKICVMVDILEKMLVDFKSMFSKLNENVQPIFAERMLPPMKEIRSFLKIIDSPKDAEFSADFGDLSDTIERVVLNEIYKQEAIIRNRSIENKN